MQNNNSYTAISRKVVGKVHATTPKGIVGGFEFPVIQRNLKELHESHGRLSASAKERKKKVGSTATV